jgi:SAM-dependent methyltransferase
VSGPSAPAAGPPIADREVHRHRPPVTDVTIYDFREPDRDWAASRLEPATWTAGVSVLDAGCGPGAYIEAVRARIGSSGTVVGLDIGHERAALAPSDAGIVGDVQALPFADAAFDVVLALHMLYHVPDIAAAVAEYRRVLRPGGQLVVTTNSEHDQAEFTQLFLDAGGTDPAAFGDSRFCMENAEPFLWGSFDDVEVHVEESVLRVPAAGPIVTTFDSGRYMTEGVLEPGLGWDEFLERVRQQSQAVIDRTGSFAITCRTGIYVCR